MSLLSQLQVNRDEETAGRDSYETQFQYVPIHDYHRVTQLLPRFQQMAQEQLANRQQQQDSQSHQGATPRRELRNAHIYTDDIPALVDVFMPRDDAPDTEDHEMDVTEL